MSSNDQPQFDLPSLFDAHNHLQDERLAGLQASLGSLLVQENIRGAVVNGSCEADWVAVRNLAKKHHQIIPSFGYHPWYIKERSAEWQKGLTELLDDIPSAIGEIGLDRWIKDADLQDQEQVFEWQLHVAAERNLPVSIHCLQAWGRLLDLLRGHPRPRCGFILHSFGGPQEMIEPLARLGAYFSFPGYFAHKRKARQREAFCHVPPERLLIETDAPDQLLPESYQKYSLAEPKTGKPLNHPGNLGAVYAFAAKMLDQPLEQLTEQIERNFKKLFASLLRSDN
jgi:TatD DNase family protein